VRVADLQIEEHIENRREHRVPDVTMTPGHGVSTDLTGESRAEDIVEPLLEGLY
jgi:hypothetical protein